MTSIAEQFAQFRKKKRTVSDFAAFRKEKLKGADGKQGPEGKQGLRGEKGQDGKSVSVQEVVNALLTSPEFLEKVKGQDGKDGAAGRDGQDGITRTIEQLVKPQLGEAELEQKIMELLESKDFEKAVQKKANINAIGGAIDVTSTQVGNIEARVTALENNPSGGLQYLTITETGTTTYTSNDFIFGNNIIGVNASGEVTIRLPDNLTAGTIITVNDESLSALTNNITVETYLENV